ncbi:hypothetical protein PENSPDRAFT_504666 [Peniophora sp. CONT]|nr:hypothetical protein PENSPDRAFT_504666 [Peniophora sp. CONT]
MDPDPVAVVDVPSNPPPGPGPRIIYKAPAARLLRLMYLPTHCLVLAPASLPTRPRLPTIHYHSFLILSSLKRIDVSTKSQSSCRSHSPAMHIILHEISLARGVQCRCMQCYHMQEHRAPASTRERGPAMKVPAREIYLDVDLCRPERRLASAESAHISP